MNAGSEPTDDKSVAAQSRGADVLSAVHSEDGDVSAVLDAVYPDSDQGENSANEKPTKEKPTNGARALFDDVDGPHSGWLPVVPALPDDSFVETAEKIAAQRDDLEREVVYEESAMVRPYALTGGRTKSNYALELETLVSTKGATSSIEDSPEHTSRTSEEVAHHAIVQECQTPRSVAELVSALRVPLGVARVLISDAADAGLVTVHQTLPGNDSAEAHLVLMERVLSGLRRL